MQELNRVDLPLYEGKAYIHPKEDDWYNTPDSWKIWVQYKVHYQQKTKIGWIMDESKRKQYWLERKTEEWGKGYEFRRTPVPGTRHKQVHISKKRSCGFRREMGANLNCPDSLVRGKRKEILTMANSWSEEIRWEWRTNHNRGWKRTKKKKQWMK